MPEETPLPAVHDDAESWERLSLLFETVMSLPSTERSSFLDRSCGTDAALRAELLTLISVADDAPQFLRELAVDVIAPAFHFAAHAHPENFGPQPSLTGRRVRHFEVLHALGTGGMGAVYLGRDTMLDRYVALKFLPSEQFTDPAARRRLMREAQAASALNDPNVCAMYAVEETDDGGLCLVMSYCSGGTLRDRIRNGPLTLSNALSIATQLASGLASAHRLNIVHRDLKPANIGFAERGATDAASSRFVGNALGAARDTSGQTVVKILDFGVAVRSDTDNAASGGTAAIAGTLPYMAPEVLRGSVADARADVWAVGIILHEMISGERPFTAPSDAALMYAIIESEPAPLTDVTDAIPVALTALVSEMLAKDPANRPDDGTALLARLERVSARTEPATATPAPSSTPAGPRLLAPATPTASRRTSTAFASAMLVCTLIAVVWWRGRQTAPQITPLEVARSARPLPLIAVLPFAIRGAAELDYLQDGSVDLLTPAFDATGLVHGVDPNSVITAARIGGNTPLDSLKARTLAEQLGADRYVVGSVVRAGTGFTLLASLYRADGTNVVRAQVNVASANLLSTSVDALVRQLVAGELRAPGDTVAGLAATMTTSIRALRAYLDGERELRDARPAAAVAYFTRAVQEDSSFALAWYRLARAARWSEVDTLNLRASRRAFDLAGTLPLRLQQLVRGYYALRIGSPAEAERQFRQIVADYPSDVDAWMLLGETLFDNNQFQGRPTSEAIEPFRRVMALDMRNREVTAYLMELAARANRRGELDTLFQMYFTPNSAGEQPGIRATYLALHARREELPERRISDPQSAQLALRRAGSERSDRAASEKFANVLIGPANSSAMRVEGLLALATLDWSAGNVASARGRWHESAMLDASSTTMHRALMFASPAVVVEADTLRSARMALQTLNFVEQGAGGLSRGEQESLRMYLVGLLSRQLRDSNALGQAQRQLAAVRSGDRLSAPLSAALGAHLAVMRGELESAIPLFERSMVALPYPLRSRFPALGQQVDRFAYAEALRLTNRSDDARRWYASIADGPALFSAPYDASVLARLERRP